MSRKLAAFSGEKKMTSRVMLLFFMPFIFSCTKNISRNVDASAVTASTIEPLPGDVKKSFYVGTPGVYGRAIPSNFLGFSFEAQSLVDYDYFNVDNGRFVRLIQSLGMTGSLRFGGGTADHLYFNTGRHGKNGDSTWLTPADIDRSFLFTGFTGFEWRPTFAFNLGTGTLSQNVDLAKYIYSKFSGYLLGFEIGNEPDLYTNNHMRPAGYTFEQYKNEWNERYPGLHAVLPDLPFSGPSTASTTWVLPFAQRETGRLNFITSHFYQLGNSGDSVFTIDRLLSGKSQVEAMATQLNYTTNQTGIPWRVNETSTTAVPVAGVSNTFASALWAVDYLYTLAYNGGSGANFQTGGDDLRSPIAHVGGTFIPRPLYYGMLMFSKGCAGKIMSIQKGPVGDSADLNLSVYGVKGIDGKTRVTIVNKDSKDGAIGLSIAGGPFSYAFVLRLAAPSVDATTGVTLGGNAVTPGGEWAPPATYEQARLSGGYCALRVPAHSAALVILE